MAKVELMVMAVDLEAQEQKVMEEGILAVKQDVEVEVVFVDETKV